jgi:hypothetical protein
MTDKPLPDHIEDLCAAAAQNREPVLLVGTDDTLLERVARRIHTLTPAQAPWPDKKYDTSSCHRKMASWDNDTVHLSDVEYLDDMVAYRIVRSLYEVRRARLVFSSTTDPVHWPKKGQKVTLLRVLRRCLRIDMTVPASDPATDSTGLTVRAFSHNEGYTSVKMGEDDFLLSGRQSEIIRLLDEALGNGHPWVHKDTIAAELNVHGNFRVRDAFRRKLEAYSVLIQSNQIGNYRLRQ